MLRAGNAGAGAPNSHARMVDEAGGALDEYSVIYFTWILSVFLHVWYVYKRGARIS